MRAIACLSLDDEPPPKQEICCSRMFGKRLRELEPIRADQLWRMGDGWMQGGGGKLPRKGEDELIGLYHFLYQVPKKLEEFWGFLRFSE